MFVDDIIVEKSWSEFGFQFVDFNVNCVASEQSDSCWFDNLQAQRSSNKSDECHYQKNRISLRHFTLALFIQVSKSIHQGVASESIHQSYCHLADKNRHTREVVIECEKLFMLLLKFVQAPSWLLEGFASNSLESESLRAHCFER